MGFFNNLWGGVKDTIKNVGYGINDGVNTAVPYMLGAGQVVATGMLGPQAGAMYGALGSNIASGLGHPEYKDGKQPPNILQSILGGLFGGSGSGGLSVQTKDFSVQTGGAAYNSTNQQQNVSSFLGGIMGNPIRLLLVVFVGWLLYRIFRKKKR